MLLVVYRLPFLPDLLCFILPIFLIINIPQSFPNPSLFFPLRLDPLFQNPIRILFVVGRNPFPVKLLGILLRSLLNLLLYHLFDMFPIFEPQKILFFGLFGKETLMYS